MRTGNSPLVVGVRSAVFAPLPDLGLIIVDEEHEASFRQEEMPSYNARDVAVKRGQMEEVPVILGSATPSLETYHNSSTGRYHSIELPERVTPSPDPEIILVDMASPEERDKSHPFLTKTLIKELGDNLEKGGQSILFLNRRGFAPFVLCDECHEAVICPNCSVTLTYHRKEGMVCHYCAHNQAVPDVCPNCSSASVRPVGAGTQRLEDALTSSFPEASIERLDRDALNRKGTLEKILTRMDKGEIQILVGTQILAKGHDFPGVTLAGILNAEQALDFPDFRSPERTFQIITQVSGRAGRGERRGKVVVQSYSSEHYAVSSALKGDYLSFYEKEKVLRSELGYPPFGRMGRVIVEGANENKVSDAITRIAAAIKPTESVRVLGPSPAPLSRIRNRHRWHFLVLAGTHSELAKALFKARREPPPGTRIHIRVDPYQLL
jgi:primosomal protein N' (replication factor Y)